MWAVVVGMAFAVSTSGTGMAAAAVIAVGRSAQVASDQPKVSSLSPIDRISFGNGDTFRVRTVMSDDFVAIADYLKTGEPDDYEKSPALGAVYVLKRPGPWSGQEAQTLVAPEGAEMRHFGIAMATNGRYLAIAAEGREGPCWQSGCLREQPNAVYMFKRTEVGRWEFDSKVIARRMDGAIDQRAANSLAFAGDTLFVGSSSPSNNNSENGLVYAFHRGSESTWSQVSVILAPDKKDGREFGCSLAADRDHLLVGQLTYRKSGAAFLFARGKGDSWTFKQKLQPLDGKECGFGYSVALSDGNALVGSNGSQCKPVLYEFEDDRLKVSKVKAPTIVAGTKAGMTAGALVALSGGKAALSVGDKVLVLERQASGWKEAATVSRPAAAKDHLFPESLNLRDDSLIVSAEKGRSDPNPSAVYYYKMSKQ